MSKKAVQVDQKKNWDGGISPFNMGYGKVMMWFFLVTDAFTFTGFLAAYGALRHRLQDIWPIPERVFNEFPFLHGEHPLMYVALMTFILIMSSVTMVLAVEAGHRMNKKSVLIWLGLTICGGLFFDLSQVFEWTHFIIGSEQGAMELTKGMFTLPNGNAVQTQGIIVQWATEAKDAIILPWRDTMGNLIQLSGNQMSNLLHGAQPIFGANLTHNEYGVPLFADFFFFVTGFHGFHVFLGTMFNFIVFVNVIKGTYEKRGHYEMLEKTGLYWHFVDLVWVFIFTFFYLI